MVFTDPAQLDKNPLRIGMSMTTDVNLHDQNGPALAQSARTEPRFSTDVYKDQLADANAQIERIIHENMGQAVNAKGEDAMAKAH